MHSSGRALADVVPAKADNIICEQPIAAATPLAACGRSACSDTGTSAALPARLMLCRADGLADLTQDVRELRLAIEAGGPLSFCAGQCAQIEFAPGLSRHYSIASTPAEEQLVFQLRRTAEGKTSSDVAQQLRLGDKVKVSGPLGSSYLRDEHAGPPAMVEATDDLLLSRGIAPSDIHVDAFRHQPLGRRPGMR